MTCKDCVHYDICIAHIDNSEANRCLSFKDKSKFVELPCKVGDTVFIIGRNHHEAYINTGRFRVSDIEKMGKTIFLTKEEAEKALKEREVNDKN